MCVINGGARTRLWVHRVTVGSAHGPAPVTLRHALGVIIINVFEIINMVFIINSISSQWPVLMYLHLLLYIHIVCKGVVFPWFAS